MREKGGSLSRNEAVSREGYIHHILFVYVAMGWNYPCGSIKGKSWERESRRGLALLWWVRVGRLVVWLELFGL